MSKSKQQESQQQSQGVTLGTQGNEDQPTPHGDDLHYPQIREEESRAIPNQEKSSARNQDKSNRESDR